MPVPTHLYRAIARRLYRSGIPALLFTLVVIIAIWGTLIAYVVDLRASVDEEARQELANAINAMRVHTEHLYHDAKRLLRTTNEWLEEQGPGMPDAASDHLRTILNNVQDVPGDMRMPVGLVNSEGRLVWREPQGSQNLDIDLGNRDFVRELQSHPGDQFYIGVPRRSVITGDQVLPVSMRAGPNSLDIRVIATGIAENEFSVVIGHLTDIAPSTVGVIRGDGTLLFVWPPQESLKGRVVPGFTDVLARGAMAARAEDILPALDGDGLLRVTFTKVDDEPIVIFAGMKNEDLALVVQSESMIPTVIAVLATLVVAPLGAWLIFQMQRRAEESAKLSVALTSAEAASESKSHFLANMSHELRTPLNAIIGFSDVMRDELLGPLGSASYKSYADDIGEAGRHLLGIISQILDTAKLESGNLRSSDASTDLGENIRSCMRMLVEQAAMKRIDVVPCPLVGLPPIRMEAGHLRQVVINLLGNAIKFSHPGGKIDIDVTMSPERMLRLEIRDGGIGIRPADMDELFKPFGQVEKSLSRHHGGVGLGLVNTRRLVEAYGGKVHLESVYGRGTAAIVELPIAA